MNTSFINTLLLIGIISMFIVILLRLKKTMQSSPLDYAKIQKTYDNICKEGIPITIPKGKILSSKLPLVGKVVIPDKDATMKIPIECN